MNTINTAMARRKVRMNKTDRTLVLGTIYVLRIPFERKQCRQYQQEENETASQILK